VATSAKPETTNKKISETKTPTKTSETNKSAKKPETKTPAKKPETKTPAKKPEPIKRSGATFMARPETVERKWYVVDATDVILGRLASQAAAILRGKNKPTFTPHVDCGDYVIIINCDKVAVSGKKLEDKFYRHHTGHIGGLKSVSYKKLLAEKSDFAIHEAIRGMLPKNSLGRQMIKKLKLYKDDKHLQQAQMPVPLALVKR
jgi:large subunit ribosomal protein L13